MQPTATIEIIDDLFSESYMQRELSKQIQNIKQLDYFVNERIEKLDHALFRCKVCGRQTHKLCNIKYHIERHFTGLKLQCSFCKQIFEQQRGEQYISTQIRKHEASC